MFYRIVPKNKVINLENVGISYSKKSLYKWNKWLSFILILVHLLVLYDFVFA